MGIEMKAVFEIVADPSVFVDAEWQTKPRDWEFMAVVKGIRQGHVGRSRKIYTEKDVVDGVEWKGWRS